MGVAPWKEAGLENPTYPTLIAPVYPIGLWTKKSLSPLRGRTFDRSKIFRVCGAKKPDQDACANFLSFEGLFLITG